MAGQKHILVYIARHGQTVLNAEDCFRGPLNPDLDEQGRRDAHRLAFYFKPIEIYHIFSSDKKRSMETAKIISQQVKTTMPEITPHKGFRAWDVGHLGGKPKNPENIKEVECHVQNPDIPIKGGESLNDFRSRVRPLIGQAVKLAQKTGIPVLIVAHSSIVREAGAAIEGSDKATIVHPGGVAAIYVQDGELHAEPIFKADVESMRKPIGDIVT